MEAGRHTPGARALALPCLPATRTHCQIDQQDHTQLSHGFWRSPPLTARPPAAPPGVRSLPAPPCSAAAADATIMTEQPNDGSAVSQIMVPEWAGMSYDAQYDDIFSKPLNLKRVTPKPDPAAQAKVRC